ncbi:hypothetical protein UYO_1220 [Lachnospiraceae bacterium JC7]|nr:hypothetical protein UYO_1220 [Lachnospiraceae bacterium JC7]
METRSKWTIEELKKYQFATLFKMHKAYVCFVSILDILLLIVAVASFHYGYNILAIESVVFAISLPLSIYIITIFRVKRNYSSSKFLQNTVTTFKFDEDRFEAITDRGSSVIAYADLYRILETKTNFYFFMSNNQALTVIKENCSPELISFLHEKTLKK